VFALFGSGDGDGWFSILRESQPGDQVVVQLGQMARAIRIAKFNVGQFWNQIDPPQPFSDRRFEFPLQYVCHARYLFHFHLCGAPMVKPCSHGSVAPGDFKKCSKQNTCKSLRLSVIQGPGMAIHGALRGSGGRPSVNLG
jgi:hypothetical protein